MKFIYSILTNKILCTDQSIIETDLEYFSVKNNCYYDKENHQLLDLDIVLNNTKEYEYVNNEVKELVKIDYTKNDFIELLTPDEWRLFEEVSNTDNTLNRFYTQLLVVDYISLLDIRIQQALQYCIMLGILNQERYEEIFEGVL